MNIKKFCLSVSLLGWFGLMLSFASLSYADNLSYDKYAPVAEAAKSSKGSLQALAHLPVYPFEVIRYPMDLGLNITEKYHIPKKLKWMYDELDSYGIKPDLGFISFSSLNVGAEFDLVRMTRQKERFPDSTVASWVHYASEVQFNAGGKIGLERIAGTNFFTHGLVNYENRPQEHFYGIGTHSSAGDSAVYKLEDTTLEYLLGYKPNFVHTLQSKFAYHNVNTGGGKDGGRYKIGATNYFDADSVPGLDGDELLELKSEWIRDTRNHKGNSSEGSRSRLGWGWFEGVGGSDARFFKYEAEGSKYFSLGSPRRVLALHALGEHNDKLGNHYVPFHQMPRLGGHSFTNRISHPLRGFDFNRFTDDSALLFNMEYRYTIWEYRDFKTDAVFFFDEGQVFKEFSDFKVGDFRESYGTGLRWSLANAILLSVEVAHGDEGTNFYVKSSAPF